MSCRNKILDLHSEALHITDHGVNSIIMYAALVYL